MKKLDCQSHGIFGKFFFKRSGFLERMNNSCLEDVQYGFNMPSQERYSHLRQNCSVCNSRVKTDLEVKYSGSNPPSYWTGIQIAQNKNDPQMEFTHLFTERESDISYLFTQTYNSVWRGSVTFVLDIKASPRGSYLNTERNVSLDITFPLVIIHRISPSWHWW